MNPTLARITLGTLSAALALATPFSGSAHAAPHPLPESPRSRAAVSRAKVQLAPELGQRGLALGNPVFIRTFKRTQDHLNEPTTPYNSDLGAVEVWMRNGRGEFELLKSYPICAYSGLLGPKLRSGDRQSPEGFYSIRRGSLNPNSKYHLSMNIGYPNAFDRAHGRNGDALMIHGKCESSGCLAVTDEGIEEIYTLVSEALRHGQEEVQVHAFPFPLDSRNLRRLSGATPEQLEFWNQLRPGYEAFERERVPPRIRVNRGRYEVIGSDLGSLPWLLMPEAAPDLPSSVHGGTVEKPAVPFDAAPENAMEPAGSVQAR